MGSDRSGTSDTRGRSRRRTRVLWLVLLAILALAAVGPASASESSGVAAWGLNTDGQLGNDTTTTEKEAVAVKVLTEATVVAGGELHSLALLKTGKVMAWGDNADGQLGNGTTTTEKEPVEVKGITEAVAIAAGADYSLALLKSGKVMAWGLNRDGQLGNGTTTKAKEPVEVKGITEAVGIAAGHNFSLAVLKSGKVMAWGENEDGQLGNDTTTTEKEPVEVKGVSEASAVAGGEFHSLALLKSGKLEAWGLNTDGQLGNGTTTTEKEPVEVKGISEAAGVAAGHNHSIAVLKSGKVMAWGLNTDGQLGNGTTTTEKEPVEVIGITEAVGVAGGELHSLALLKTGKVMAWGYNNDGQLGNETTTTEKEPVEVKGLTGAAGGISAGANFSLASYATKPANTVLPAISGEAEDERTLTASTGTWTGTPTLTYSYQWESCNTTGEGCASIEGATSSSYTVAHAQVGDTIRVKVTAKNSVGEASASSGQTGTVAAAAPANTVLPAISGEARDERTLTASTGTWRGTPTITYGYQWESCNSAGEGCTTIEHATEATYRIPHGEVGHTIRARVSATNSAGEAIVTSVPTAAVAASAPRNTVLPTISGEARDEQTLTASTGTWTGTPPIHYTYQWFSCEKPDGRGCSPIEHATEAMYKIGHEEVGETIVVRVGATNSAGYESERSAQTASVLPSPPADTALPTISGEAKAERTVSASNGGWDGTPPLTYAYQWESCDAVGERCLAISGATSSRYRLYLAEIGTTLRVLVTASNVAGSASRLSEASAVVGAPGPREFVFIGDFGTEGAGDGQFDEPGDVAVNAKGDIWVLDSGNDRVEEFNPAGEYMRQFGSPGEGDGQMSAPSALAVSAEGDVWVADTGNQRIDEFNKEGAFIRTAGSGIVGATEGIAVDRHGDVWVSATYDGQLVVFNAEGEILKTVGSEGSGDGQLDEPEGLSVDASGHVWVAEWGNNRVQEFDEAGEYLSNFGSAGSAPGEISYPYGITVGDGNVFLAEPESDRVQEFTEAGEYISELLPYSEPEAFGLTYPVGLVFDAANDLLLTDSANNRVEEWAPQESAPANTEAPSVTGTPKDEATLTASTGSWTGSPTITYAYQWESCNSSGESCTSIPDATNSSYMIAHEQVGHTLKVQVTAKNSSGEASETSAQTATIVAEAPVNTALPTISGDTTAEQTLSASTGEWAGTPPLEYSYQWESCDSLGEACLAISGATGSSYTLTASEAGTTLRVVMTAANAAGRASAVSGPSGVVTAAGAPEVVYTGTIGSEGEGEGQFEHPAAVALAPGGDIWVLDQGNDRVEEFSQVGEYLRQFGSEGSGPGQMASPTALAVSPEGDVWVLDTGNQRIEEFNEQGEFIRNAGEGLVGYAEGIAVDRQNDVWVSATYEGHLVVFNDKGEHLKTVGTEGSGSGQLAEPAGLTVDAGGHVWVAEWGNSRVQEFNEAGEYVSQLGVPGFGPGEMFSPYAVVTHDGRVFVAEVGNDRIQEFDEAGKFLAQLGTPGSEPGQLELEGPVGVAINSAEDLWVTDSANNRVEEWTSSFGVMRLRIGACRRGL